MPNVYQGEKSCWARNERIYVPGSGVDVRAARGILALIEKELKRGWTYDKRKCRRIRMTPELARKRALYLIALAKRHHGAAEAVRVAEAVRAWLEERRLLSSSARRKIAVYAAA
jgi:hypothetical protein